MFLPEDIGVYYVTDGEKAYYTFLEPEGDYWVVDSSFVMPFILEWPELLKPQMIH
jgi:hypothetical protein